MRKVFIAAAAFGLLAACNRQDDPTLGQARVAVPERVSGARASAIMHERHEGMEQIGKANKLLSREMKAGSPDMAAVKSAAAAIDNLARKASGWFPLGTGPDIGKTRAKAEIWQKPEDYSAKMAAFQRAAHGLNAAAQAGNGAALSASFSDLGKSCKACHDSYRSEKKD